MNKRETTSFIESSTSDLSLFLRLCSCHSPEVSIAWALPNLHPLQSCMYANIISSTINKSLSCYEEMTGSSAVHERNVTWSSLGKDHCKKKEADAANKRCYFAVFLTCFPHSALIMILKLHGYTSPSNCSYFKKCITPECGLWLCSVLVRKVQQCEKHNWRQLSLTDLPPSPSLPPHPSPFRWHGVLSTGAPSSAMCSVRPPPRRAASMACPSRAASRTTTSAPSTPDSWRSSPSAPGAGLSSSFRSIMWVCHTHGRCETPQSVICLIYTDNLASLSTNIFLLFVSQV